MTTVTISPKFQVVIPREVREPMGLYSGQKAQIIAYRNRIEIIPLRSLRELRGALQGIDTAFERDADWL